MHNRSSLLEVVQLLFKIVKPFQLIWGIGTSWTIKVYVHFFQFLSLSRCYLCLRWGEKVQLNKMTNWLDWFNSFSKVKSSVSNQQRSEKTFSGVTAENGIIQQPKAKTLFSVRGGLNTQIRLQTKEYVFGTQKQRFEWGLAEMNMIRCNNPDIFFRWH